MSLEWRDSKFIAFDFETSGKLPEYALQPWRVKTGDAWPTSLAIVKTSQGTPVVGGGLNPSKMEMRLFLEEAADTRSRIVGWNTAFDIALLLAHDLEDLVFANKWLDGMLLWRHWIIEPEYDMARHHKKSYTLKNWVREFMPKYAGYEEDIDFHDPDLVVRQKLHRYNVRDTLFTLRAAKDLWNKLLADDPRRLRAALIEADILPHVALANLSGLPVDPLSVHELQAHLTAKAAKALKSLEPHGVTEKIVRSPTQLATLLYDTWKLPVLKENTGKKTGKTTRSTDKEVLHELSFKDERAKTLKEYREALNNKTKFADGPDKSREYNGDDRVRPSAIVFGTYSGRLTYASKQGRNKDERPIGFALHQEKRDKEFRRIIRAPDGYTLMEFDAAGQEFRWMAIASNDPVMLNLCMPGEDPHSYMGAQIAHRDYRELIFLVHAEDKQAGNDRKLGKVANLSLQYRTSAPKLLTVARVQYNIPMELPEAQHIHATYPRTYRKVPVYWEKQIAQTKRLGYVETFAGRRVQVVGNWNGKMGWSMGSTAINYRIQGTGADQKYLALSVLGPYLRKIGAYFAWDLHDGIYIWVPNDKVDKAAVDIKALLDNLPYQRAWNFIPPIPMPWDCKVGKTWGDLHEYKFK